MFYRRDIAVRALGSAQADAAAAPPAG